MTEQRLRECEQLVKAFHPGANPVHLSRQTLEELVAECRRLRDTLEKIRDRALNEEISMDLYWDAKEALNADQ